MLLLLLVFISSLAYLGAVSFLSCSSRYKLLLFAITFGSLCVRLDGMIKAQVKYL